MDGVLVVVGSDDDTDDEGEFSGVLGSILSLDKVVSLLLVLLGWVSVLEELVDDWSCERDVMEDRIPDGLVLDGRGC